MSKWPRLNLYDITERFLKDSIRIIGGDVLVRFIWFADIVTIILALCYFKSLGQVVFVFLFALGYIMKQLA